MATPTTVDTIMIVAMMTKVAMTTARPMTAPMLITPAEKDDGALASVVKVLAGFRHACAAGAGEWPAWYSLNQNRKKT